MPKLDMITAPEVRGQLGVPRADPRAGDLGPSIAGIAKAGARFADEQTDIEVRRQTREAKLWQLTSLSEDRSKWSARLKELQDGAEEGAPGFGDQVRKEFEEYQWKATSNAPPMVRQEYEARLGAVGADVFERADIFQGVQKVAKQVRDYDRGLNTDANSLLDDPSQFDAVLSLRLNILGEMDIPADKKAQLTRAAENTLATASVSSMVLSNPKSAMESLKAGEWDRWLDADKKLALIKQADVSAKQNKAEVRELLQDHVASLRATGVGVPGVMNKVADAYDPPDVARIQKDVALAQRFYNSNQQILYASPADMTETLETFKPKPGQENFADQQQSYNDLLNSARTIIRQRADDPAGFAASMPQVRQVSEGAESPETIRAAVRSNLAGQEAMGIPKPQQRVLSKAQAQTTISNLISKPMAERGGILMQLQETYGDQFPSVMRDLSDKGFNGIGLDPRTMVLASIAGNPALSQQMATVLDTGSKELRDGLDRTAVSDAEKNVRAALSPWAQTVRAGAFGMEREPMLNGIASAVEDLAVSYVRNGENSATAATRAADQVINDRFTVQDTYYIPKDVSDGVLYSPARIGSFLDTQKTREAIEAAGVMSFGAGLSFKPVPDGFTPQEQALIQYHRDNLSRGTELKDEQGTTTVLITGMQGPDGREYLVPGFFDGKRQSPAAIAERVGKIGWDRFPSYATLDDAEQATKRLHDLIEEDSRVGPNVALDRERTIATAVNSGFWATNANGTGVYLMVPFQGGGALPLLKPDGSRYEFSFRSASDKGFQPAVNNPTFGFEAQP